MSSIIDAVRAAFELVPRAMIGGALAGAACGAVGTLLRWRRLVWAGFAVPEAATVGTAAALGMSTLAASFGLDPSALPAVFQDPHGSHAQHVELGGSLWISHGDLLSLVAAALAVLWLVPIGRRASVGGERAAAACFLLATTAVVLLVSQSAHGTEEIKQLAVGRTLMFLSPGDERMLRIAMPLVVACSWLLSSGVAALSFDRDHARATGRGVHRSEAAFAIVFLFLCAILAARTGPAFLFAYLTLPAAGAERLAARPFPTIVLATVLGALGSVVGAAAAVRWDLPFATASTAGVLGVAGASIALAALLALISPSASRGRFRGTCPSPGPGRGSLRSGEPRR